MLEILQSPKVNADQIAKLVAITTAKKMAGELGQEVGKDIMIEAGLGTFDPTGLLSAVNLFRAAANGDIDGVLKSAASILVGKLLLAALCTIS